MPLTDIPTVFNDFRYGKTHIMPSNMKPDLNCGSRIPPKNGLRQFQYQKWQNLPDFDRNLRFLKQAEKTVVGSKSSDSNHIRSAVQFGFNSSPTLTALGSSSPACSTAVQAEDVPDDLQQLVQVQRLNEQDSKYFGYAPKHAKRDLVICNMCMACYTKVGFNNHMKLKHSQVWATISSKPNASGTIELCNPANNIIENSRDSTIAVDGTAAGAAIGSPTDLSGTISSCSNASSSSSSLQSAFTTIAGSSTGQITALPLKSGKSSSRYKSSSSKSSSSHGTGGSSSSNVHNASNSSYHARSKSSKHHHASSSSSSTISHSADKSRSSSSGKSGSSSSVNYNGSKSKKNTASSGLNSDNNTLLTGQSTMKDLSLEKVNSSSSLSDARSKYQSTSNHSSSSNKHKKKGKNLATTDASKSLPATYESQRSSHKSKSHHHGKSRASSAKPINVNQKPADYHSVLHKAQVNQMALNINGQVQSLPTVVSQVPQTMPEEFQTSVAQNSADENSIAICIEEMLDTNILNEFLSNTQESDIPFDESVLDSTLQANESGNGYNAPNGKRMRFDNGASVSMPTIAIDPNASNYTANIYNQQIFNQADDDQQSSLTSIEAAQLQQLFYQQQLLEKEQKERNNVYTTLAYDSQQLPPNAIMQQFNVCNVSSLTDDNVDSSSVPSYIYLMDQQSQQQAITDFLTEVGYSNVDDIQVTDGDAASTTAAVMPITNARNWRDLGFELSENDLTKIETAKPLSSTSSSTQVPAQNIKPESKQRLTTQTKINEDLRNDLYYYAGLPRPAAMNTFGLVKIPFSNAMLFRRQLTAARKIPHTIWPTHGAPASSISINTIVGKQAGSGTKLNYYGDSSSVGQPHIAATAASTTGRHKLQTGNAKHVSQTIYVNKSSVIPNEQIKCMKLTMVPKNEYNKYAPFTAKKLSDLLSGKLKDKPIILRLPETTNVKVVSDEQQSTERVVSGITRIKEFYEKRTRLMRTSAALRAQLQKRQRYGRRSLRYNSVTNQIIRQFHKLRRDKQAKARVLRTINECGINSTANQWKISNNNSANAAVPSNNSDLMRV